MSQNNLMRWLIIGGALWAAYALWKKSKERENGATATGALGEQLDAPVQSIGAPVMVAAAGTTPFAAGGLNISNATNIGVAR